MAMGLSNEVDSVITLIVYGIVIATTLIGFYVVSEYVKKRYRQSNSFTAMKRSKYDWPTIIIIAAIWIVPITLLVIYKIVA